MEIEKTVIHHDNGYDFRVGRRCRSSWSLEAERWARFRLPVKRPCRAEHRQSEQSRRAGRAATSYGEKSFPLSRWAVNADRKLTPIGVVGTPSGT